MKNISSLRITLGIPFLAVLVLCLTACSDSPELPPPPDHEVVKIEDVSFGDVRRLQYRIRLPEHYQRSAIEELAHWITAELARQGESVNALSMLFYGPDSATDGFYDIASIYWAPGGEWGDADSVRAGDYSSFLYDVTYNAPREKPAGSLLAVSDTTGLLGVPLPVHAQLTNRVAGNPSGTADPREEYEISATAEEILAFYESEMPRAGWKKTGPYSEFMIPFKKGNHIIGVIAHSDGGSFTLMGS
jgi:hypothetical protein